MRAMKLAVLFSLVLGLAAAQPAIATGGVINGASFAKGQAVAPGSLVAIFGSGLATSLLSGDTVPLSTSINGTSVTFNGIPAGLYFVSDGQVNAQVPWNALSAGATGNVNVVVTTARGASAPASVPIAALGPEIFSEPPGAGYAVAINADGSLAAPLGAVPGLPTRPAKVGDTLILYATGLGAVNPPVANGAASLDQLRFTVTVPTVMIGGQIAQVPFSGLTPQFPGVNQLNVVVPNVALGDSIAIQIQEGGITSSSAVVISVGK